MGKSTCCEKVGLKKGPWTPEEDKKLLAYIQEHGHGNWRALPEKAGLQRCGKSCRLRWTNYLRPDIKRGKFSLQEEQTIIQLHALLGNRWSAIAAHLPRRTDNEIKNHWNTHIKKRLNKMGIDPVTHKPKTHAFGSTKDAANLSHMAQWESARLEAEARLVRESKCVVPPNPNVLQHQLGGTAALPQLGTGIGANNTKSSRLSPAPLYCLDVLKAWQGSYKSSRTSMNESDCSTSLLSAIFASDDLESPTSIFNFPNSTVGNAKPVVTCGENGGHDLSCSDKPTTQIMEFKEKTDHNNTLPTLQQEMTYPIDCTWFGDPSFTMENEDACVSNNIMQGTYGDLFINNGIIGHSSLTAAAGDNFEDMPCGNAGSSFEEMRSYCSSNSMVNLVNASSYGSPLF